MPKLIKDLQLAEDNWLLLNAESAENLSPYEGEDIIVPLSVWHGARAELGARRGRTAVWLDSHEVPGQIGEELQELELIALNFPVFRDGRAFSSARELRQSFAYTGEIRAVGDVLRDQLFYMHRCGFNAFSLRDDQDPEACLQAFRDFHDGYQSSVDQPLPLFRRRADVTAASD